ncbi:hypothetical protein DPMN_040970 [Dreissena polymorpha]|uniref:Uncharacterized protein n=1 Tax=Dreissena polymorpha TaxID=45954 RepID=A0A9D4HXF9_DREPO|nr:hypothetical protein DPMN_040970 [Dreissena polymorpha]
MISELFEQYSAGELTTSIPASLRKTLWTARHGVMYAASLTPSRQTHYLRAFGKLWTFLHVACF